MTYQRMQIIGNLGRDPEMRYTPSGQPVTKFSVATERQYTHPTTKEKVKDTTWFNVEVWGKQGEACNQYLRKGSKVLVEGRMKKDSTTGAPRIWTGDDGVARTNFEITAQNVRFLSSNQSGGSQAAKSTLLEGQSHLADASPPPDDDIPF